MRTLSLQVHHYEKVPNTQQTRLTKTTPYVRVCRGDNPPLFVQGGRVFSEGRDGEVRDIPEWFAEEMAKLSPTVREEVGWKEPAPALKRG